MTMMRISSSCVLLFLIFSLLSCGSPGSESQGQGPSAPVKMTVSANAGLVSVEAQNAPLSAVLTELSRQAQITISMSGEMHSDRLTLSFQDRPMEAALRQVLAGQSYAILYRQEKGQEVIAGVKLYAQQRQVIGMASTGASTGSSSTISQGVASSAMTRGWGRAGRVLGDGKPVTVPGDLSLDELRRSLSESQDPAQRSATLEAISNRGEDKPVNPIMAQALSDADQEVRETALNLLKSSLDPVPIGPLASMATREANPDLRIEAMTLMTDQLFQDDRTKEEWATVSASLSKSLTDPDQDVRDQAEQLLSQLSETESSTGKQGFGRR